MPCDAFLPYCHNRSVAASFAAFGGEETAACARFIEQAISMYFDALSSNPRLPFFMLEELVNNPERRKYMREKFVYLRFAADVPRPALANGRPSARVYSPSEIRSHPHGQKDPQTGVNNLPNMQKRYIFGEFMFV